MIMSRILITGVAGFLGSHLADALIANGHEVTGIDNLIGGYLENVPEKVNFFNLDLNDLDALEVPFKNIDIVVHAACTAYEGLSVFSPALVVKNTTQITTTVLSASIKSGVKKIVHMSSMARYGTQDSYPFTEDMVCKPQDPYGIAKLAAELLVSNLANTHGLEFVILVPHNIIGPRQKFDDPYRNVASIMINRILSGKQPIIYGDGNQIRCFSFIEDVVNPCLVAIETETANGMTINIGPDQGFITINNLAEIIARKLNFDLKPIYMAGRPQEVFHATCSADLARKVLSYETTTDLDAGLNKLISWIQEKGPKPFNYHLPIEFITERTPRAWSEKLM